MIKIGNEKFTIEDLAKWEDESADAWQFEANNTKFENHKEIYLDVVKKHRAIAKQIREMEDALKIAENYIERAQLDLGNHQCGDPDDPCDCECMEAKSINNDWHKIRKARGY